MLGTCSCQWRLEGGSLWPAACGVGGLTFPSAQAPVTSLTAPPAHPTGALAWQGAWPEVDLQGSRCLYASRRPSPGVRGPLGLGALNFQCAIKRSQALRGAGLMERPGVLRVWGGRRQDTRAGSHREPLPRVAEHCRVPAPLGRGRGGLCAEGQFPAEAWGRDLTPPPPPWLPASNTHHPVKLGSSTEKARAPPDRGPDRGQDRGPLRRRGST